MRPEKRARNLGCGAEGDPDLALADLQEDQGPKIGLGHPAGDAGYRGKLFIDCGRPLEPGIGSSPDGLARFGQTGLQNGGRRPRHDGRAARVGTGGQGSQDQRGGGQTIADSGRRALGCHAFLP